MWFKIQKQHVQINILAKPNAKKTTLLSANEQVIHISLHAKPHHGATNKELISYFSRLLKIPKTQIHFVRGESSKYKQILVPLTATVKKLLDDAEKFIQKNC